MKPIKVSGAELAFGGDMKKLLPESIPATFIESSSKWHTIINDWFYVGITDVSCVPKKDVDTNEAIRHIKAILASFEPKHEVKIESCAYLMSCFFEEFTYSKIK